jgi:hypothetical protein
VFAFLFELFEFTKAALGIHQATSHLLEAGDLFRNDLAGARVDLTMPRRHLGRGPMHYGTYQAQFCQGLRHARCLLLWKARLALQPQTALRVHLVAAVACRLPL